MVEDNWLSGGKIWALSLISNCVGIPEISKSINFSPDNRPINV